MRDEKEGRKKQARSNKQQGKAMQYTQHVYSCTQTYFYLTFVLVMLMRDEEGRKKAASKVIHTTNQCTSKTPNAVPTPAITPRFSSNLSMKLELQAWREEGREGGREREREAIHIISAQHSCHNSYTKV